MGRIVVDTILENMLNSDHTIRCDALVDTGTAHLTLLHAWHDRLGSLNEIDKVDVETADQSLILDLMGF